jgi:hypothetical protein
MQLGDEGVGIDELCVDGDGRGVVGVPAGVCQPGIVVTLAVCCGQCFLGVKTGTGVRNGPEFDGVFLGGVRDDGLVVVCVCDCECGCREWRSEGIV